jgi:hypothetical protein
MNALYLTELADKTRRGLRGRLANGKSGGGVCFGYRVVPAAEGQPRDDREINESEAVVVRRIFESLVAGLSPKAIARTLNAEGIAGPRRVAWSPSTIYGNHQRATGILNNALSIGQLVWNRQRFVKDRTRAVGSLVSTRRSSGPRPMPWLKSTTLGLCRRPSCGIMSGRSAGGSSIPPNRRGPIWQEPAFQLYNVRQPIKTRMDRPERTAAIEYLRRKGTESPVSKLLSGLRSTFQKFEQTIDRVPEALRPCRPGATSWSVHEIVDHLVESHRPAVLELRALCACVPPDGGPIPARLTSAHPFDRPWAGLVVDLRDIHAKVLELVAGAGDATPITAKAPFVMVVKVPGPTGPEVVQWIEALDWKAYAQALRIHTHEHCAQVERTVAALCAER